MNKLIAMQAFVRVVEAGTFTKAAESMDLPKPSVTRMIQALEKQLDVKLLNRTTRRVTPTPEGSAYYERVSALLGEVDELESSMMRAKASPRGRLKVVMPAALALAVIIPALPKFHARYPDIQIDLGVGDRRVDLIGDNIDCAIRAGLLHDQSLVARHVGEIHLMACASPDYLKRHGMPRQARDIENGHTVVGFFSVQSGQLSPIDFDDEGQPYKVMGRYVVSVNDANAYVAAGLAGLGIVHAPSFLVQAHISSGALEPLRPQWQSEPVPVHVVYPPNRHLSNKVRVFVDWVAELFARHDLMQRKSTFPRV
ncbi:LysR family transcriptional regulator [Polaromonas sp.]|uniref:LysR substrate-binding domain-containing protein n=1 Tax=Polaromonas sp. TaxID=1869339 RepID=UPI00286AE5C5|nr:LysR family transcriptional regulator [Polaromonas sp.]